jgi:lysophospholipase L1-like esterase
MKKYLHSMTSVIYAALLTWAAQAGAQDGLIDALDTASFKFAEGKGQANLVDGKVGQAMQLAFPENSKSVFAMRPARATSEWDKAAGLSFWVKGDGKSRFGGLQLIWNEDYALRYDYAFPIHGSEWRKITVAWRDFVPVLPSPKARPLDPRENAPSKVTQLWFGKWWYWRDVGAETMVIDELRLEPVIELDTADYKPAKGPLARVAAKLKAGQPVTIVTMGDSLTDVKHWTNQKTNWPALLKAKLKERFGSEVTIVNPAIGGTQLRQNVVLMPIWAHDTPAPDLVTVCFGYNDWDAGMRGPQFQEAQQDAVDRIRRATKGQADVLLMTPARALTRWNDMAELGEATRQAAGARNAGIVDLEAAFERAGKDDRARLIASDKVHLSLAGQELIAESLLTALTEAAK